MTATPKKKTAPRPRKQKAAFDLVRFPGPFASVVPVDDYLRNIITASVSQTYGYYSTHQFDGEYPMQILLGIKERLKNAFEGHTGGRQLLDKLQQYEDELAGYARQAVEKGEIEFMGLAAFFTKGAEVVTTIDGELVGGIVENAVLKTTWMGTRYYEINIKVFNNMVGRVHEQLLPVRVGQYNGPLRLPQLPLRPVTDEDKVFLTEQGKKFIRYASGASYIGYTGQVLRHDWWSAKAYRADGRAMLDPATFNRIDNDGFEREKRATGFQDNDDEPTRIRKSGKGGVEEEEGVPEGHEWRCYPFVYGFSFSAKQWGRFALSGVKDIEWRDDAFDKLVLAEEDKELIRALVEHQGGTFQDLIEGKGGGVIFLLHGPPGEGKTLTAEAVAELLHKPLYSVSVGELGTNPDQLEERLREVLDISTVWDAVVLMDEADIFLEARDEHDIVRNAMVGVFLRLLEYHQGVMFLTTNRVRNIDHAFYSRISIALHFTKGEQTKREKIWTNLLKAAKIEGLDPKQLSSYNLNGRQVKSIIRLSQTLAKARNVPITAELVGQVVARVTKFEEDLKELKGQ